MDQKITFGHRIRFDWQRDFGFTIIPGKINCAFKGGAHLDPVTELGTEFKVIKIIPQNTKLLEFFENHHTFLQTVKLGFDHNSLLSHAFRLVYTDALKIHIVLKMVLHWV